MSGGTDGSGRYKPENKPTREDELLWIVFDLVEGDCSRAGDDFADDNIKSR